MSDDKEPTKPNIRIVGNVSGGNVNVGGEQTFSGDVHIDATIGGDASKEAELKKLIDELKKQLEAAKAKDPKAADEAEFQLNGMIAEATRETPDEEDVKRKVSKFEAAVKVLEAVTPGVMTIATQIVARILTQGH